MKRTLCVYASVFALFSLLSIFLGKIFCIISAVLVLITLTVSAFTVRRLNKTLFRDVFIGLLFVLSAVLIACFSTLPQLDEARKYDGEYLKAEGVIKSVSFSDPYAISVVDCDTVNGIRSSQKICVITNNRRVEGIDIGMRVTFGGEAEFDDSFRSMGNECFLTVFPSYCEQLGTDGLLGAFLYNVRGKIREIVENMDNSDLLKAVLIGDKSGLSKDVKDDFKKIGTSHVLAISGLHLSIVVMTFYGMLSKIGVPYQLSSLLSVLLAVFYLLIAGSSLSLLRSAQMTAVFFFAKFIRRKKDSVTSLFLAGVVILFISQWSMFNVGFLLSFFATFGILVFVSPISRAYRKYYFDKREAGIKYTRRREALHHVVDILISSSATTVAATVCTLPIILPIFNEFSLFSLVGNLATLPVVKYYLLSSFPSVLLQSGGVTTLSFPLTFASEILGKALLSVTKTLARLSPDTISVRRYFMPFCVIILIVVILIFVIRSRNWRSLPILTLILALFIPAFNLVSDGIIYNTAVIDTVSNAGAHTTLVRHRGETYLLDQTSSDSTRLGGLDSVIVDEHISHVDKAVFITDGALIDKRVSAILTLVDVGEITVLSSDDEDYFSLRLICKEEGTECKIINGSQLPVSDGITAYNEPGIATAFVIKNKEKAFLDHRLLYKAQYVGEIFDASLPFLIQSDAISEDNGHYRLHA